jgi:hypothetical protein
VCWKETIDTAAKNNRQESHSSAFVRTYVSALKVLGLILSLLQQRLPVQDDCDWRRSCIRLRRSGDVHVSQKLFAIRGDIVRERID